MTLQDLKWTRPLTKKTLLYLTKGKIYQSRPELLVKSGNENLIFLFLNQNICCRYSKEPSQ